MPRRSRDATEGDGRPVLKRGRYSFRMTRSRAKRLSKLSKEPEGRVKIFSDEDFKSKFKVLEVVNKPGAALKVVFLDFHLNENRREHHTKEFDQPDLILRRGQAFTLTLEFDREIDITHDNVILQLTYGDQPKESKGSLVRIPVVLTKKGVSSDMARCWGVCTLDTSEKSVTLTLTSPPDIYIGKYNLFVESNLKDQDMVKRYKHEDEIIIIFNAWCKEDTVYLADPAWRKEYVLNETGNVWVGSQYKNHGRPWNFGQFSEPCLEAALYLLDKGELADSGRNSPVSIIRVLSALANSCDEEGVLEGRWTSEYPKDCTAPWLWRGSVNILKEFMETGRSVQYGQCWVFSCLVTTLLRALGIPTRSVTNFESAHDTDCSMTIDFHYKEDGSPVDDLNDSKWNFHVWNESWMQRRDLPDGYDGWQAHDATPQELSEGVMRCGPAPLKAIKEGHVYLNYDVNFILSEVNGDRVNWRVHDDDTMEVLYVEKNVVGRKISTKAIGSDEREDITLLYKYPEGSAEERKVMQFVSRFGTRRKHNIYNLETTQEVELDADLPNETMIGDDIEIKVNVINKMNEERKVDVRLTVLNAFYTGISGRKVKTEKLECIIPGYSAETVTMSIPAEEYEKKRNPEGRFQIYVNAKNVSNGRMHVLSEVFMLSTPDLTVDIPSATPYMTDTGGKVEFKNTTSLTLTHGVFSCDAGNGLIQKGFTIPVKRAIRPGESVTEEFMLHPTRRYHRRRRLNVTFSCDQIVNIEGSTYTKIINTPPKDEDETDSSDDE
ncbi:protein-glutamine gamma-glutamyltransferase K-like [Mizuhopecten yessoensis]|uniref:Protein-glutamine gamma-glutamyltransferase K n=1 Tax=Mizuhopecten yessoensis TaxID=6573 RepID=A0A210QPK9_MIZYE|nr:protein-glutamine gamma-glutamyltransferase K-like [Mizuhopecten yessoensis]OWF50628.1 Protein-glutamine gamma-glutamyltransferase K [Mizuhopecten yessoensis]